MMNLQQEMSRICSRIQRLTGIRCTLLEAPDGQWPDFPCACGSCQTVIHEVSRCIESHLTEKIALEEAAAHVHFSRSYLCRISRPLPPARPPPPPPPPPLPSPNI